MDRGATVARPCDVVLVSLMPVEKTLLTSTLSRSQADSSTTVTHPLERDGGRGCRRPLKRRREVFPCQGGKDQETYPCQASQSKPHGGIFQVQAGMIPSVSILKENFNDSRNSDSTSKRQSMTRQQSVGMCRTTPRGVMDHICHIARRRPSFSRAQSRLRLLMGSRTTSRTWSSLPSRLRCETRCCRANQRWRA
jgi:hypothetical protein